MVSTIPRNPEAASATRRTSGPRDIPELLSIAAHGLKAMFEPAADLFCHRLVDTSRGLQREGISQRYTAMTLLGLSELAATGCEPVVDLQSSYRALIRDTGWIEGAGDLGLLAWVTAELAPERTGDFLRSFEYDKALTRYADSRQSRTMELAWFLTGLTNASRVCPQYADSLKNICSATYEQLKRNQGQSGLFGHMGSTESIAGRVRGHIGSFADQVYPIYALSKYAGFLHDEHALNAALRCASAVCKLQGTMGQWWWLYDARTGRVSSYYPVYAVHQHGMAPMALFALQDVAGRDFTESIYRGLGWIYGVNERGLDMRDTKQSLIWRCLQPRAKHAKYWQMATSAIRRSSEAKAARNLTVLREQRPYEYGWLLFAFASRHLSSAKRSVSAHME
jgi:hypothetical protein